MEERRFGDLTVRIDRLLCVGFGDCIEASPDLFAFDDDGIATFRADAPDQTREALVRACESCPVDALTLIDAAGTQIAP